MVQKAKAYSYLRFSTPEQMKGDSFRRQIELTRKYAKDHNLELDESLTFQDLGVSAYRGRNIQDGALRAFVEAFESGYISRGSYLLVESLDRLSRNKVQKAFNQFSDILNRGINIVTLQDGKVYTMDSLNENFADLIISLATMYRAHEESQTKGRRLKAAWRNKRRLAQESGVKLTSVAPAWLAFDKESGKFSVLKERAKVIDRIFKLTLDGLGGRTIATKFNVEGVPTFGKSMGWQVSYIRKILDNEAVIGRFQPMQTTFIDGKKKRVADGDPIESYFPEIIKPEIFLKARDIRKSKKISGGRKGQSFSNLFTGLAICGVCGAPMHYINKGKGPRGGAYLVCSGARAGMGCKSHSWKYLVVQSVLIEGLNEVDFRELYPTIYESVHAKLRKLEDEHIVLVDKLEKVEKQLDNVVEVLADQPNSKAMQAKLVKLEETKGIIESDIEKLERQISDKRNTNGGGSEGLSDALRKLLKAEKRGNPEELLALRSRLHQLLKRYIQAIKMFPANGRKEPRQKVDLHGIIEVSFHDLENHFRKFYVEKGQRNAHGYEVIDDTEDAQTHHIEITWPPGGRIVTLGFLEPYILDNPKKRSLNKAID